MAARTATGAAGSTTSTATATTSAATVAAAGAAISTAAGTATAIAATTWAASAACRNAGVDGIGAVEVGLRITFFGTIYIIIAVFVVEVGAALEENLGFIVLFIFEVLRDGRGHVVTAATSTTTAFTAAAF